MIIGTGLIANAFRHDFDADSQILIFASGVSNSSETYQIEFAREQNLLSEVISRLKNNKLIYFSTCSIYDPDLQNSPYVRHKLEMEELVKSCPSYLIFRAPQVIGKSNNPFTLCNFLHSSILTQKLIHIWGKAKRHLIDIDDLRDLVKFFLLEENYHNQTINIAIVESASPLELIQKFENILGQTALYTVNDKGNAFEFEFHHCRIALEKLGRPLPNRDEYLDTIIKKYYG